MSRARTMLVALATIAFLTFVDVARADATTQPTRTTTVFGIGEKTYSPAIPAAQHDASVAAYEAALADAKTTAERGAKVLGVRLGLPITVESISSQPNGFFPDEPGKPVTYTVNVKIVFELLP